MKIQMNRERGSVLATTLVLTGLVTIVVAALLAVVHRQNYFTARSTTWCSEIPIAEAGIEEAMAHLNSKPPRLATNGWSLSGSNIVKSRYFTNGARVADGYFYTAISTSQPPRIVSVGYGRIPLQTNYTHRTVAIMTQRNPQVYGIMSRGLIHMGGGSMIDSFDSSNPLYSTGGRYDPTKRTDHAGVATLSSATPAIEGGQIYGSVSTGPGGTVDSHVGDGAWMSSTPADGGVQYGHSRDDFNTAIPDATLPPVASWSPYPILAAIALPAGNYKLNGGFNGSMNVVGAVRVWITGSVNMTGGDRITIQPGASLEIYVGNTSGPSVTADFGGGGIVNGTQSALALKVVGLPTCRAVRFRGNAPVTGQIYAPNADVSLNGTPDLYGSIVGKTVSMSGNSGIHYDEALGTFQDPAYVIVSWEELPQ